MTKVVNVAVLGATTLTGEAVLAQLAERDFPLGTLYLLSPSLSVGDEVQFKYKDMTVLDAASFDFNQVQLVICAAGAEAAAHFAPIAVSAGCIVIDTSPQFRQDTDVPLVVAGVNSECIADYKARRIIACPNAATTHLLLSLKPIVDVAGLTSVSIATYQAVSGSGKAAVDELADQSRAIFNLTETENIVYSKRISFNILPQVGDLMDNGYSVEEMKMVEETRKVLAMPSLAVNPTAVRVPVFYGHGQAVQITTQRKITAAAAIASWQAMDGIVVVNSPDEGGYPTPIDTAGNDEVLIGRVREAIGDDLGLNYWLVADNIHAGTALNSVRIAEKWVAEFI
ncbi:aspartate-semialdehyde dehydrogenase [Sulfuriferula thiophila]|uniref:aspartate-semialdehyde dehydrogenase n=1 Tax=Sulfuriferula thiophila TaxID=1781211 RepID=UPI000F604E3C|nr:aspartate-semialdehyde dehydrogenase [Sulfuriferula thiophila]